MNFNPDIHFLGKLCNHGHEFEDSGFSLRYKTKGKTCKVCISNFNKIYRRENCVKGHRFKDIMKYFGICEYCGKETLYRYKSSIKRYCSYSCASKQKWDQTSGKAKLKFCMAHLKDLTGQRFGKLIAIRHIRKYSGKQARTYWECICDCGSKKIIVGQSLRGGVTKSCGCLYKTAGRKRRLLPHEAYKLPEYKRRTIYLRDYYIKDLLTNNNTLKKEDIPQSLVDLQREVIRANRLLKELTP
jgi:hypothetical protein